MSAFVAASRARMVHERPAVRAAIAARAAALLIACARDEEADALLAEARRDAARADDPVARARVEVAMAAAAEAQGDDARAVAHLAAARSVKLASAWLVEARLARAQAGAARAPDGEPDPGAEEDLPPEEALDLAAEIALERATSARLAGDLAAARPLLDAAHEAITRSGSTRLAAAFELEVGLFAGAMGDARQARERVKNAVAAFAAGGMRRDAGRATLRYAELLAESGSGDGGESEAAGLHDHALARLFADYVSFAAGELRARAEERRALHQLEVTLETLRDGVLACDEGGVVTSINAAGARMLRVPEGRLVGHPLDHDAELAPLAQLLASSPRLDGTLVRLPRGTFVVTSRPVGDDHAGRGVVATLVDLDRAQKIAQRLSATRARYGFHDIVGDSSSLAAAVAVAKRAAAIDATVLVTGESGTGKEVIAQAIHTAGPRAGGPFVGINCAALPRELLEAELFGYEKGAFTGARTEESPGKFEQADGGTILLDEIGDMPLDMQAKLLRVLQERVVTRVGGRAEIPMRARVIATTHRDLERLVDQGHFRMDLLFRLRILAIELPALRDRPEDIVQLGLHHLRKFAEQQRKSVKDFGPKVIEELARYDWPGNVRELANVMEAEVSLIAPDVAVLERLATRLVGRFRVPGAVSTGEWRAAPSSQRAALLASAASPPADEPILPLAEVEKRAYLRALERLQSVSKAAEALGVSKVTFYAKLRSWGMHPKDRVDEDGAPMSGRWVAAATLAAGDTPPTGAASTRPPRSERGTPSERPPRSSRAPTRPK